MATIVPFRPRSYEAKLQTLATATGLEFKIAGTLEGFLDFCITEQDGSHVTYSLSPDDAIQLAAFLNCVIKDIRAHCLYDRDPLLRK